MSAATETVADAEAIIIQEEDNDGITTKANVEMRRESLRSVCSNVEDSVRPNLEDYHEKKFYRKRRNILIALNLFTSLCLIAGITAMVADDKNKKWNGIRRYYYPLMVLWLLLSIFTSKAMYMFIYYCLYLFHMKNPSYYFERSRYNFIALTYMLGTLIVFSFLFRDYPSDSQQWHNAFVWTQRVMAILSLYATGQLFTDMVTAKLALNFNVRNFDQQLQDSISDEIILTLLIRFKLSQDLKKCIKYFPTNRESSYEDPVAIQYLSRYVRNHLYVNDCNHLETNDIEYVVLFDMYDDVETKEVLSAKVAKLLFYSVTMAAAQKEEEKGRSSTNRKRMIAMSDLEKLIDQVAASHPKYTFLTKDYVFNNLLKLNSETMLIFPSMLESRLEEIFEARANLSVSLRDAVDVVKSLRKIVSITFNFLVLLGSIQLLGANALDFWVSVSSIVLGFTFIFGQSLKQVFDSALFIFILHPFDVGDMIKVGPTEERYVVKSIKLYSTILVRWDGAMIKFQNTALSMLNIINVKTSNLHSEVFLVSVDMESIDIGKIAKMEAELKAFVATDPSMFSGELALTMRGFDHQLKAILGVWCELAMPNTDPGRCKRAYSRLLAYWAKSLVDAGVSYSGVGVGMIGGKAGAARDGNDSSNAALLASIQAVNQALAQTGKI